MIGRRALMGGIAAGAATGVLVLQPALAGLAPTPAQTTGPFYPLTFPVDSDSDLVRVVGQAAQALGTITHVAGRVLDVNGRPVGGARVEIWQCDARGRYHHPRDSDPTEWDGGFQGYGRTLTAADGTYRFRTIKPVPYPGRTPHIHFAIEAPGGGRLVTQMYVAGEPRNAGDGIYGRLDDAERERVTVALSPAPELESDALKGTFDIVLA